MTTDEIPTRNDGDIRAVFGNEAGGIATRREHKDGPSILLTGRAYRSHCNSLNRIGGTRCACSQLIIKRWVANGRFSQKARLGHHFHYRVRQKARLQMACLLTGLNGI
jgi:hypothetical protein